MFVHREIEIAPLEGMVVIFMGERERKRERERERMKAEMRRICT